MKLRVLILSAIVPVEGSGGGCLAMKRHFVDRNDFEIAVASEHEHNGKLCGIPNHVIHRSALIDRLSRSRFLRIVVNFEQWINWWVLPRHLVDFGNDFKPDIIFSVVDDWHMGLAWQLSKKLRVPLVIDFQDLFALSNFTPSYRKPYALTRWRMLRKYRFLNQNSDAVFYTSDGMKEWFSPHTVGEVLFPIGDAVSIVSDNTRPNTKTINLVYAGNCYGAYGRMLLRLANAISEEPSVGLKIFSQGNDWSVADLERHTNSGIYQGPLPFSKLKNELKKADAFLTVMSFESAERTFVSTSFTTKWLDYAPYGKPIFVWGPNYSTAAEFAGRHNAGFVIDEDVAVRVADAIKTQFLDQNVWKLLAVGASDAASTLLSSERIHGRLLKRLLELTNKHNDL